MKASVGRLALVLAALAVGAVVFELRPPNSTTRVEKPSPREISSLEDEGDPSLRGRAAPDEREGAAAPTIRGRVVDAATGQGVPDVPVLVCGAEGAFAWGAPSPTLARARSSAKGEFMVGRVPKGVRAVCVLAMGGGWLPEPASDPPPHDPWHPAWYGELEDGNTLEVRLRVVPAAQVMGRILLPDGQGAAGARVALAQGRRPRSVQARGGAAVADSDGEFRLEAVVPQQEAIFEARLPGYAPVRSDLLALTGGDTSEVTLRFAPPTRGLFEVVSAEDGSAVAAAQIVVSDTGAAAPGAQPYSVVATTNEDGVATLMPLPPRSFVVLIRAKGFLDLQARGTEVRDRYAVKSGATTSDARFELEPAARVSGRILLPADRQMDDLDVLLSVAAMDAPAFADYSHTVGTARCSGEYPVGIADSGAFEIPVPRSGLYVLTAVADSTWLDDRARASVEVRSGQEGVEITLVFPGPAWPGPSVDWWVLDLRLPDGSRPQSVAFDVHERSSGPPDFYRDLDQRRQARTPDGRWRIPIREDSPGLWLDIAARRADGSRAGRKTFGPLGVGGGERTIRLPEPGRIRGRAVAGDGSPLVGVDVCFWTQPAPEGGCTVMHAKTKTDRAGRFVVGGLGEDVYGVGIVGHGPWLPPPQELVAVGTEDVVLRAKSATRAVVTVVDPSGGPLQGAWVRASPKGSGEAMLRTSSGRTDAEGRVVLERLDAGATYALRASIDEMEVRIDEWSPRDTVLRARRIGVSGHVVDQNGAELAGVHVGMRDAVGAWHTTTTSARGAFRFERAPAGTAQVFAAWTAAGLSVEDALPLQIVETGDGDLRIVLRSDRDLLVKIRGVEPRRLEGSTVHLVPLDPAGGHAAALHAIARQGSARFRGLESKTRYLLWARFPELGLLVHEVVDPDVTSLTSAIRQGGKIGGQLLGFTGGEEDALLVLRGPGFWIEAGVDANGRFVFDSLPHGDWRIEVRCNVDGVLKSKTVPASTGDVLEIDCRTP